jgi:replicative DNA helicase
MTTEQHESRPDCERAVMGCILHDADRAMPVCIQQGMRPDWFADTTLRAAYTLAERLYGDGKPVDYLTLTAQAKRPESIEVLDACEAAVLTVAYLPHYLDMLESYHRHAVAVALAGTQASRLARIHPLEATGEIEAMQEAWETLGAQRVTTPGLYELAVKQVEEWKKPQSDRPARVRWPLQAMNDAIGALTDELVYICAGESVGKTALMLQFAMHNGMMGTRGAIASLESAAKRLIPRMLSQLAGINTLAIDRGHYTPADMAKVEAAAEKLRDPGFVVHDRPMTTEQIMAWGRLNVARGARYIVVDNTRHVGVRQRFSGKVEEMSYVSMQLKRIRDELRVPVIALHHTSKEGDVSWSRDLRKDVDVLLFVYKNEAHPLHVEPTAENGFRGRSFVDMLVDKNRDARAGMTLCAEFDKERQVFL